MWINPIGKLYWNPVFLMGLGIIAFLSGHAQPVNQTSFEDLGDSALFTLESWQKEGFTVPWVDGFDQERAYVDKHYAHSGDHSLRIFYPKGGFGPSQTGAQAPLQVPPASQYYISYWLRFDEQFSWGTTSEGGKLPGLAGGQNCSGCTTCTGSNGFSARLMWRTGGKAVLYLYNMDKKATCGDDYSLTTANGDFYFQKGKWHHVTERVKVNTGTNHDGEVEVWMDGQQAVLVTGLEFVSNGDKVDNLYFSTFHGGSTADWAPVNDCYIWFDDVVISIHPEDVFSSSSLQNGVDTNASFDISPQPAVAGSSLFLKGVHASSCEVMDESGKIIQEVQVTDGKMMMPKVKPGVYLLRFWQNGQSYVKKMMVE